MALSKNKFQSALDRTNESCPPVWFMRQAGRYHSHYQALRRSYSFLDLCKKPEVACEATMGPIRDFDFDAAILFSDLLFPLEAMGMGLTYEVGPKLGWHLETRADLARLREPSIESLRFQGEALSLIRRRLPASKGLLGFVGGPLTLFFYAASGSHRGDLSSAHRGIRDGRFDGFCEKLTDLLARNILLQANAGADTVAILDTCAGELDPDLYRQTISTLGRVIERYQSLGGRVPITYYSKGTDERYWRALRELPIAAIGVDWNVDLARTLREHGEHWAIQGNIDPHWLFLPERELEAKIRPIFETVRQIPQARRRGWIAGLGHGILPKTPEKSVKLWIRTLREMFS